MSLAKNYNRTLRDHLRHYAAWPPVTGAFSVGDYGGFDNGIFVVLGNIREFGVEPETEQGTRGVVFDFVSSNTRFTRVAGGVSVTVWPEAPVEAKLTIEFARQHGALIKSATVVTHAMRNVDAVANRLHDAKAADGRPWKRRWRVIRNVHQATDPVLLMADEEATRFDLCGRADILKRLEAGSGSGDLSVATTSEAVLKVTGGTGPIAMDLFRLRVLGGAGLRGAAPQRADAELDDEWPTDIVDDDAEVRSGSR